MTVIIEVSGGNYRFVGSEWESMVGEGEED